MPDHRFAARLAALAWAGLMCANGAAAPLPAPRVSTEQQFQLALEAQSAREYRAMLLWLRRAGPALSPLNASPAPSSARSS